MTFNIVVLVSGSGTLLQAILDHQGGYRVEKVIADQPLSLIHI